MPKIILSVMKKSTSTLPACYAYRLKNAFEKFSGNTCLIIKRGNEWKKWSYKETEDAVFLTASALNHNKIGFSENVVLIGDNTPEWVIAYHGIMFSGACVVPVDPNLPHKEIELIVQTVKPKIVFCTSLFSSLFKPLNIQTIRLPSGIDEDNSEFLSFLSGREINKNLINRHFNEDDPFAILFTSGTTGSPKGAVLLQRNLVAAGNDGPSWMELTSSDCAVAVLPLHHVFGFVACCGAPLIAGLSTVFVPIPKGPYLLEAIRENKVSMLPAVPQMLEIFLQNINRGVATKGFIILILFKLLNSISSLLGPLFGREFRRKLFSSVHTQFGGKLTVILSGGSSIKKSTFKAFQRMGFNIAEGYGLTETFGPITLCPVKNAKIGSVGKIFPGNSLKIINGELRFKGQTVFGGYYNMPEASSAAFDEDGFFKTGDIGRISKDGFIYITGRSKDIIVLESGKNVHPDELENEYLKSSLIEEIGIFGLKKDGRETVAAVIVPVQSVRRRYTKELAVAIIEKEINHLSHNWPSYRKLSEWAISFHPLPRTSTKKIRKSEVSAIYSSLRNGIDKIDQTVSLSLQEEELMGCSSYKKMVAMIKELTTKPEAIHPKALLEADLGLDSLKRTELFSRIEEDRGSSILTTEWDKIETVSDAALLLETKKDSNIAISDHDDQIEINPAYSLLLKILPPLIRFKAKILWGLKIENRESLNANEPLLFYANHESNLDPFIIFAALPWSIRKKTFAIGKAELLNLPIIPRLINKANLIPVDRYGDPRIALRASRQILNKGYNLLIFPEGTRSKTGQLGQFKSGASNLLRDTNATAVPIRLFNTGMRWPVNMRVVFGKPHKGYISSEQLKELLLKCN
jgi:long-chain acyl-CoA synthetase